MWNYFHIYLINPINIIDGICFCEDTITLSRDIESGHKVRFRNSGTACTGSDVNFSKATHFCFQTISNLSVETASSYLLPFLSYLVGCAAVLHFCSTWLHAVHYGMVTCSNFLLEQSKSCGRTTKKCENIGSMSKYQWVLTHQTMTHALYLYSCTNIWLHVVH